MIFDTYRTRVNKYLNLLLAKQSALNDAMRYSVLTGGKRFRPILTYTTASLYNIDLKEVDACACAIELIHIYSLIHDDLPAMDNDDMRHNQPSSHKTFGEAQAILAGDALQTLAFEVLSTKNYSIEPELQIELIRLLAVSAYEMAVGQSIDLSVVSKKVDVEFLNNMHQKKTGSLISCAVKFGAFTGKNDGTVSLNDYEILESYSHNIGLAYQIQDDVLEISSTEEILGKRQNSDLEKGKPTYPSIIGLDESIRVYKDLYKEAIEEISCLSVNAEALRKLTEKLMQRDF
ncbi:MAG: farnesyl diphosphate synthase [Pseudomonadota bacterium]|nr:farnesyl diphosphate synthase [Pseudomonadota bacterium]